MTRAVSADPDLSQPTRWRVVKWALWPIAASLLCLALFASARAGCGATDGRDATVLGAATVTGLATAASLWGPLRAWQALAVSVAASAAVGGGLIILGVLFWIGGCAN